MEGGENCEAVEKPCREMQASPFPPPGPRTRRSDCLRAPKSIRLVAGATRREISATAPSWESRPPHQSRPILGPARSPPPRLCEAQARLLVSSINSILTSASQSWHEGQQRREGGASSTSHLQMPLRSLSSLEPVLTLHLPLQYRLCIAPCITHSNRVGRNTGDTAFLPFPSVSPIPRLPPHILNFDQ